MTQRRSWTEQQDKVLTYLKDVLQIKKWSEISRKMEFEYYLPGRNGKQCRERYTNHLDSSIISEEFTNQEEKKLFILHDKIGNKWSIICKQFNGRTDNHIKNHFHSKLRKAIRKINKQIKLDFKKTVKPYKLTIIYKIVQSSDYRFSEKLSFSDQILKFFNDLKNSLLHYAGGIIQNSDISEINDKEQTKYLISQLDSFEKYIKIKKVNPASSAQLSSKFIKPSSQSKRNLSTSNSQCGSEVQIQSFDNAMQQPSSIYQQISFQYNYQIQQSTVPNKKQNKNNSSFQQLGNQTNENELQFEAVQVKNFYSFLNPQKLQKCSSLKQNLLFNFIQEKQLPEIELGKKASAQSYESLKQFEDCCLNDSEVHMMLKRFESFSNIEEGLFE